MSTSKVTQQKCVCNGTPESEGNRCIQDTSHARRDVQIEEVFGAVNPSSSTRRVSYETDPSQSALWRTMREEQLNYFHGQLLRGLQPKDNNRRL
jgi:hypothetical protein